MKNAIFYKFISFKYVPVFIIFTGLILRIFQFVSNRSLWLDEAKLALNIVNLPFYKLNEPLSYGQAAPIGFLYIEKLLAEMFGNYDYILRLFPLIAGCISVFIVYSLSKKILSGLGPLIITAFFTVSDRLIYFSSEVKQYSSDVFITLILLLTFGQTIEESSKKRFIVLGITGAIVLWFSYSALFVLSAAGLALLIFFIFEKRY